MEDKKVKLSKVSCNEICSRNESNEIELIKTRLNEIERSASSPSSNLHHMQDTIESIMTSLKRMRSKVEEKRVLSGRVESEEILDAPLEDASGLSISLEEQGMTRMKTGQKRKDCIGKDSTVGVVSKSVGDIEKDNLGRELEIIGTVAEANNKKLQAMAHILCSVPVNESSKITRDPSNEAVKKNNMERSKQRTTREDNDKKLQAMEDSLYSMPINESSKITRDPSNKAVKKDSMERSKQRTPREDNDKKLQTMEDSLYSMPVNESSKITGGRLNKAIEKDNTERSKQRTTREDNDKKLQAMENNLYSMPVNESSKITGDRSNEAIKKDKTEKGKLRTTREDNDKKLQAMAHSLYSMPVNESSKITGDRSNEAIKKDNAEKSKQRTTREDDKKLQAIAHSLYSMPVNESSKINGDRSNETIKKDSAERSKQRTTRDGSSKQNIQEKTKQSNGSSLQNDNQKCSMSQDIVRTKKNDEINQGEGTGTYRSMVKKGLDVPSSAFKDKRTSRNHDSFDSLPKHTEEPVRPRTHSRTKRLKLYAEGTMDRNVRTTDSFDEDMIEGHSSKTEYQPKDSNEDNIMALHKKKYIFDIYVELHIIKDAVERIANKLIAYKCTQT